jgi:manganese-dependent inorganic pyrophosphatase
MITYIIGHKNPDTDSICSAIALTELKKARGMENVFAARAGDLNPQTTFILKRFDVESPLYLSNVYLRAKDIMTTDIFTVDKETPIFNVMKSMQEEKIRIVPVLDDDKKTLGVVTLMDIAEWQVGLTGTDASRKVRTSIPNLIKTLKGSILTNSIGNKQQTLSLYVGAMMATHFETTLADTPAEKCIVVVGDRETIQASAIKLGIGVLIISGGLKIKAEFIEAAKAANVTIISSPYDTSITSQLVRLSSPAGDICNTNFKKISPDDCVEDIKITIKNFAEIGVLAINENGVMQGILTKSDLLKPSPVQLILVDHNEISQAVDGAVDVDIVEVVDHHRLGNFHTTGPITFRCDPIGSTSSIVAAIFKAEGFEIKKEIAGLLLAGVLSDTVILRSPTTTNKDRQILKWLEEKSGLDHKELGNEIFSANSSMKTRGAKAVVRDDFKVYTAKGKDFGIGQVETVGFDEFHSEKTKIKEELEQTRETKDLIMACLLITDIVEGTSLLMAVGNKKVLQTFEYPKLEDDVYELKNVLSRKKQVAPHLLNLFNEMF